MKVYIAGPMSGIEDHNFPAFFAAEQALLEGVAGPGVEGPDFVWPDDVVNPARINEHLGTGQEWHVYLRNDLKALCDCTAIYLLRGWEKSRGASLEFEVARRLGMSIYFQE